MTARSVLACASLVATACSTAQRCSVVLVTIDTLRADHVGCYGYARVRTPVIDRLAEEGVLFENAISQIPLTAPSHASILASLYPQEHGVLDNATPLPADVVTMAEVFANQGYATCAVVSGYPLKGRTCGLSRGFDTYVDDFPADSLPGKESKVGTRRAGPTTDLALRWLDKHPGESCFLWVHYFDPHEPYDPPAPYDTVFTAGLSEPTTDTEERDYKMALYDGEISYTDRELGRLLDGLGKGGWLERTLLVVTADHGESFEHGYLFDHAARLYEPLVRVPLIMRGPVVPVGVRVRAQASLVDLAPTVYDLLAIGYGGRLAGRSLLPLLADPPQEQPPAFSLTPLRGYPDLIEPLAMVRDGETKLIIGLRTGAQELYSLSSDPHELSNLAAAREAEAAVLEERLRKWLNDHPARQVPRAVLEQSDKEILQALGYIR